MASHGIDNVNRTAQSMLQYFKWWILGNSALKLFYCWYSIKCKLNKSSLYNYFINHACSTWNKDKYWISRGNRCGYDLSQFCIGPVYPVIIVVIINGNSNTQSCNYGLVISAINIHPVDFCGVDEYQKWFSFIVICLTAKDCSYQSTR